MVKLKFGIELNYVIGDPGCDFIFNIHAAQTSRQQIMQENLTINRGVAPVVITDPNSRNRYVRLRAEKGPLTIAYNATVAINHHMASTASLQEMPISQLPQDVLNYLYPSRYCQSDRLYKFAMAEFGQLLQGYTRVQAIQQWVQRYITFSPSTSNASTSAIDTLIERAGVCRDFAHLMIALCRALNIPARFATGIDYGASPDLGPTDFHAYVEVYLSRRWYLIDPSGLAMPMGLIRLATGRDAADAAFATIFGAVSSSAPRVSIAALVDSDNAVEPFYSNDAMSTDD